MNDGSHHIAPSVRGFWSWLFKSDADGDRGIDNLFDYWNLIGLILIVPVAILAEREASAISIGIALPLAAALIGISFAWAGRSSSLLQDREYADFLLNYGAPPEGYVYSFQLAILAAIIALFVAVLMASQTHVGTVGSALVDEILNRFFLLSTSWIAGRECWGVISFANKLAIQFYEVRRRQSL